MSGVDALLSSRNSCWQLTFFKDLFLGISPPLRQSTICEERMGYILFLDFPLKIGEKSTRER